MEDYRSTAALVGPIFDLRYDTRIKQPLTLHLRGTNFQIKVWEALLQDPGWVGDHLRRYWHSALDNLLPPVLWVLPWDIIRLPYSFPVTG